MDEEEIQVENLNEEEVGERCKAKTIFFKKKDKNQNEFFKLLNDILGDVKETIVSSAIEAIFNIFTSSVENKKKEIENKLGIEINNDEFLQIYTIYNKISEEMEYTSSEESSEEDLNIDDYNEVDKIINNMEKKELLLKIFKENNIFLENGLIKVFGTENMKMINKILNNKEDFLYFLKFRYSSSDIEKQEFLSRLKLLNPTSILFEILKLEKIKILNLEKKKKSKINLENFKKTSFEKHDVFYVPSQMKKCKMEEKELPSLIFQVFGAEYRNNYIQQIVFDNLYYKDDNVLICSPTGSGKTNMAIFSILKEYNLLKNKMKVFYVAPMKALVSEITENLKTLLGPLSLKINELSGDAWIPKSQIKKGNITVITPEKLDILTRQGYFDFNLLIIDEIHILNESRGPVVEAIVSRLLFRGLCRIIGMSATLPNYLDIANFLRVKKENIFCFGREYRPIPLDFEFISINERNPLEKNKLINNILVNKVLEYQEEQILIFVNSRKETLKTAKLILKKQKLKGEGIQEFIRNLFIKHNINLEDNKMNSEIYNLMIHGIAIHHAGLQKELRFVIEKLFKESLIQLIVSTATLSWGVNIPAQIAIIKETEVYNSEQSKWTELSDLNVIQMLGRAGRKKIGGKGILMTEKKNIGHYLSLSIEQQPIESNLLASICDHLNAEIVLGMETFEEACDWFKFTFYYVRNKDELEENYAQIIHNALINLKHSSLIEYEDYSKFESTCKGRIASYYYIQFSNLNFLFNNLSIVFSESQIFSLIGKCKEFDKMYIKEDEKEEIQNFGEIVPIPIENSKFGVLLQIYIANTNIEKCTIYSDLYYISQNASRLFRGLFELCLLKKFSNVSKTVLKYAVALENRFFPHQTPLRHFALEENLLKEIENKCIPFDMLVTFTSNELKELISVDNPELLKNYIFMIPNYEISASIFSFWNGKLIININLEKKYKDSEYINKKELYNLIISDHFDENILYYEKIEIRRESSYFNFYVCIDYLENPFVYISLISDRWNSPENNFVLDLTDLTTKQNIIAQELQYKNLEDVFNSPNLKVVVRTRTEANFFKEKNVNSFTYEDFMVQKEHNNFYIFKDIHFICVDYLIEICLMKCKILGLKYHCIGYEGINSSYFYDFISGNVNYINLKNNIHLKTSNLLKFDDQLREFLKYYKRVEDNSKRKLVILPTVKYAIKFYVECSDSSIFVEDFSDLKTEFQTLITTKNIIDVAMDKGFFIDNLLTDPFYDQVHIIGTTHFNVEDKYEVEYSILDIKKYSFLSKQDVYLYTKECKSSIYVKDNQVSTFYEPSTINYWNEYIIHIFNLCSDDYLKVFEDSFLYLKKRNDKFRNKNFENVLIFLKKGEGLKDENVLLNEYIDGNYRLTKKGELCSKYLITVDSLEMFYDSLKKKTKVKGILEIICSTEELLNFRINKDEIPILNNLMIDNKFNIGLNKAHILTQKFINLQKAEEVNFTEIIFSNYVTDILPVVLRMLECLVEVSLLKGFMETSAIILEIIQKLCNNFIDSENVFFESERKDGFIIINITELPNFFYFFERGICFYIIDESGKFLKYEVLEKKEIKIESKLKTFVFCDGYKGYLEL